MFKFFFGSVLAKSCRVCVMWFRPRALLFSFFPWDSLYIFSAFDEIFMSRGQMFMITAIAIYVTLAPTVPVPSPFPIGER